MRRYWPILGILWPIFFALLLATLIEQALLPNLLFVGRYEVDLVGLLVRLGALCSLLAAALLALFRWIDRRMAQRIAQVRTQIEASSIEERGRFLRRLDHELKNPLMIMRLAVTNLQSGAELASDSSYFPANAAQAASLTRLAHQSQRLQKLVQGLRQLAELGEHELECHEVALPEVLEEAIALACPAQCSQSVTLTVPQLPWVVGAVWGDWDLLVMAFHNLLDNALKFSQNGGQVEVRASEDGAMAVVEVADAGRGIAPEELPHIFEELYRGENGRSVVGSGLGLALVQRIVDLHDGQIRVRSRLGQGTAVMVRLPLAKEI